MGLRIMMILLLVCPAVAHDESESERMRLWAHRASLVAIESNNQVSTCEDPEPPDWLGCSAPEAPEGLNIEDPNLVLKSYTELEGR